MFKISMILCTFDEDQYIEKTINSLFQNIENIEVVIVDDDSNDNTREIIKNNTHKDKITLIHRKKTRGLASAFSTAILKCKGDRIGWLDTNMSQLSSKFNDLNKKIDEGCDIAILSRYVDGGADKRKLLRSISSRIYNYICRIFLSSKIKDYTSGIFLMKKEVLNEIPFISYGHGDFFVEFMENSIRKGLIIKEIPYIQEKDENLNSSKTEGNIFKFFYLGFKYFMRIFFTLIRRN